MAKETISGWESGAVIQSRAMDKLLRIYFAFPEVRSRLTQGDPEPQEGAAGSLRASSTSACETEQAKSTPQCSQVCESRLISTSSWAYCAKCTKYSSGTATSRIRFAIR